MEKKMKKLTLNRETLRSLENFRLDKVGGLGLTFFICGSEGVCDPGPGGGSFGTCRASCGVCSNDCATGGACTL